MRAKLSVGAEGEIVLPPAEAEGLGLAGGGEVDVVSARNAFALVTPARGDAPSGWFAGSLAALTVPEVVQFVFTSLKTGVLLLSFERDATPAPDRPEALRRKSIFFRDGQVVFASSTDPADRLGNVLVRAGVLAPEDLDRCAPLVRGGRPLGQVLVDEGILSSGRLYEGITVQVREILLGAFVETAGRFAFLEGAHDERNAVKLPERTRDLLLEGMKRVEEAERLAAELGGRDAVLSRGVTPGTAPGAIEARVLEAVDGRRTLADAAQTAALPLLEALRAAAALARAGTVIAAAATPAAGVEEEIVIEVEPPVRTDRPRPSGPFETYRRIFKRVFAGLAAAQPDARERLNSYFERLPAKQRPIFDGVSVDADGELDVAQVLVNVSATGAHRGAAAKARSLEALEDLLAFALFEVKNCLPKADADALLREVGRMQVGKA
ncbi:DUF4388 domain-containing protein [Anaeromyxobacter oryzae]|uniref:PatA-like N-terminal domain-containing protein n=1 Tax=Anaeromyxobacter oryzae TaxID=2918170 RepID=A0ABN6MSY8_9BACT|nr:DUF4388 domain-containing protein [Anaeromyxobacter oryzae]BDG04077.1 hypothetical protein AMOR_30730 [Anaeromyxobacter oryzae]